MNYFIKDVILLYCQHWSAAEPPQSSFAMASEFINRTFHLVAEEDENYKDNATSVCALLRFWLPKDKHHLITLDFSPLIRLCLTEFSSTGGAHGRFSELLP